MGTTVSNDKPVRTVGVDQNGNKIPLKLDGDQKIKIFAQQDKPADIIKMKNLKVTGFVRGRGSSYGFQLSYEKHGKARIYLLPINSTDLSKNLQVVFRKHIVAWCKEMQRA